ncbi:phosphoglycerate kinase [Candidatus Kaiserbacteria bacterium CG10_big_fil_rev_8_21_14_0_10_49_17]|uniref:Phosphoglycerate kinase n=1 Tax=Candidatus Kaiserbacteria bacterium CG10_big_fil_rev_8_21_14_0_10_49_17 TaxID=1974609 RepID=A0A2M6WEG0_9BACT|nr:MAG: phosphoglycerate kinase [Candidatus Kaiserbacteria bacterium CG10_big_fil_rev_8_21_14_0_10_49_17]
MKRIEEVADLKGVRVLVRASLNVPIEEGVVRNDFRLQKMLPTLTLLSEAGAHTIIIGHVGRDKDRSLSPVHRVLSTFMNVSFIEQVVGSVVIHAIENMQDGDSIMLENLRQKEGEVSNSEAFAKELASYADIYVNDAFPVCHREHASIVGVPKLLPAYAGIQLSREVAELSNARNPQHPSLFILGGAKFETKKPLLRKLLDVYDSVFVGGALANDFFKAKGYEVGNSIISPGMFGLEDLIDNPKIMLPRDVVVERDGVVSTKSPDQVKRDEMIVDAGPDTVAMLGERICDSKYILWNGPLGYYDKGYDTATVAFAKEFAACPAYTIVGGGDTIASIAGLGLEEKISFISSGGGALLQFLDAGTLPGIEALEESAH